MSTKRKSNWYIYLITFIIASALAAMIVSIFWDVIFPEKENVVYQGSISSDIPDASNNLTVLIMLSEEKASVPQRYMVVSYQPADEQVICIPIRADMRAVVGNTITSISAFYEQGGVKSAIYAIENAVGVRCDNYVKFDRESFVSIIDMIGKVTVNLAYDVLANDGSVMFASGSHLMSGSELYSYIMYNNASYGEDYSSLVAGSAAVSIVNSNLRGLSATVLQGYFTKLINITDTDLELDDYTKRQQALLFTSSESYNPGQYYIPYGETDESGLFALSADSRETILSRLGIDED